MNPYDDSEDQEIEELAEDFQRSVINGQHKFFDSLDLQDIISYYLEHDLKLSKIAIDQGMSTFPQEPYFHLLNAKYYALRFDFNTAENILANVAKNFEPFPELYLEQVLLAHACNKKINAEELLLKSLALDDSIPETHLLLSIEYVNEHRIQEAVEQALRAIKLDGTIAEDLKTLVLDFSLAKEDKFECLIEFFTAMTDELPLSSNMWCGLGLANLNAEKYEQAIEAFQFQTSIDEKDPFAYVNLGEAYFALSDYESAAENFKNANEKCDQFQFNVQIGRCLVKMGRHDEALQYFINATELDPFYLMRYTEIVKTFKDLGKIDEARAFLRLHISECPNDDKALEELLGLLDPEKDSDEMLELCDKIRDSYDNTFDFLDFITRFSYINDYPDFGLHFCNQYFDDETVTDSIGYFVAALYLKKGLIAEGVQHLENAILISKERFLFDFISIDPKLGEIHEVADLLIEFGVSRNDENHFPFFN